MSELINWTNHASKSTYGGYLHLEWYSKLLNTNIRSADGHWPSSDYRNLKSIANQGNDGYPIFPDIVGGSLLHIHPDFDSRLYLRLASKIYNQDSLSIPLIVLEAAESAGMIANLATRLALAFRSLYRGDVRQLLKYLGITSTRTSKRLTKAFRKARKKGYHKDEDFLSEQWLSVHFGVMPILEDMSSAASLIQQLFIGQPEIIRGHVSSIRTYAESGDHYLNRYYDLKYAETATVHSGCSGAWVVNNKHLLTLRQLGLLNPALVAWDAVPLSFVLDWAIPIGAFLKQFDYDAGLTPIRLSESIKVSGKGSYTYYKKRGDIGDKNSGSMTTEYFVRNALEDLPFTPPFANLYQLCDMWKATTALSLFDVRGRRN